MKRAKLLALATVVGIVGTWQASAPAGDWIHQISDEIHVGFWRNTCWPKPFVYPDRKAAFAPMHIMANNGWRRNNLLGSHHFNADGTELNQAGKLRVAWILTQAPIHRRTIYVERSLNSVVTGQRIELAQQYAAAVAPEASIQVVDTHIVTEGRSAREVDWTNSMFLENAPVPVLPAASESMSGGE